MTHKVSVGQEQDAQRLQRFYDASPCTIDVVEKDPQNFVLMKANEELIAACYLLKENDAMLLQAFVYHSVGGSAGLYAFFEGVLYTAKKRGMATVFVGQTSNALDELFSWFGFVERTELVPAWVEQQLEQQGTHRVLACRP
ncbi:hypothetical protein [Aureibacillus halotolerans]|uniref:N-acetylglutamate synthase-like GNAT family acetyltransferase n=1 Tax=Aureibacillus halotolerans TaxID=1508390 RepID=A0A4V3D553_9BACI|nr:hypothetical protein [Aureibacillus halotolerans]TDQ38747.1 hypothetical protein EV213_109116 [Aureibacillus halotolerans]